MEPAVNILQVAEIRGTRRQVLIWQSQARSGPHGYLPSNPPPRMVDLSQVEKARPACSLSGVSAERNSDEVVARLRALTGGARVARERSRADRGALARRAHAPAERGRRRLRAGRRAAAAVGQGGAAPGEGREARARRGRARRDRHPRAAREARLHVAERVRARRLRAGRRRGRSRLPRGRRVAALLRLQAALRRDPPVLRPAVPGVRRASTTASAPRPPTSRAASPC